MQELHIFGIHIIYFLAVVAFLLPKIPLVGKFFNIINTVIHESGHAFMAVLLGVKVDRIKIFSNTAGEAWTVKTPVKGVFVSLAGYLFSSLMAYVCFYLLSCGYEDWIVIGLSVWFLAVLAFWIRNTYGAIWVLLFSALNAFLVFYLKNDQALQIAAWFYALMILIESVWSTFVLLKIAIMSPNEAGDAKNLEAATHVPAVIWSLVFVAFSLWMAYLALKVVQIIG